MIKQILVAYLLFLISPIVSAQDCAVKLRDAENLFEAGLVEQVPALLEECLESGFTKTEEHSAYQIIIRSYLFDDKIDLAESTMLEFLKKNPEYVLSPTDNADFVYLFNKFKVKPVLQLSANIGSNFTFISLIESNSLQGVPGVKDYSNENFSFAAGLEARVRLNEKFEIGAGVDFSQVTFSVSESFLNYSITSSPETQTRIELPVIGYYNPKSFGGLTPYLKAGVAVSMNISTVSPQISENTDANNIIPRTGATENRTDKRQFIESVVIAGLGCKYKLPRSYIFIDVSARIGTLNQSLAGELSNSEWFYTVTDDLFRVNNLRFNIGYTFIFYKPFKKEE